MADAVAPTRATSLRFRRAFKLVGICAILGFAFWNPWMAFPCPVRFVLRVPCPGCGMTRACAAVFHGKFAEAHAMHPLVWIVMPLAIASACIECVRYVRTGEFESLSRSPVVRRLAVTIALLMIVVWAVRFFGAFGGPAPV